MTIDEKIINWKLQYNINREAAKILALSSTKIDKNEYLTGEEILPPDQAKFTYSPLRKAFEKQMKTVEKQGEKQIKAIAEHEKHLFESNTLPKKYDYDTEKDNPMLLKQRKSTNLLMKCIMKY